MFRLEGRAIAWLAMAALAAIASFQALSVKVMVGLPAIALAVAALDQVLLGASARKAWRYWLAGALFAVSLQTELSLLLFFQRDPCRVGQGGRRAATGTQQTICIQSRSSAAGTTVGFLGDCRHCARADLLATHHAASRGERSI